MARQDTAILNEKQKKLFEETAIPHMNAIYNAALQLSRDPTDAEDLAQDTFLRAYRFFNSFKPGTNIKSWLFTILRNIYINEYRTRSARPSILYLDQVDEEMEIISLASEGLIFAGPGDEIANAIAGLPEYYRVVVVLCDLEGLSYEETAVRVGCPCGTVMSRLHRARKLLKISLYDYARDHGYIQG